MRIDLQLCRHSEMKNFCKWFSDGNCKLSIENCKAPCEKYIDEVVEQLEEQAYQETQDDMNPFNSELVVTLKGAIKIAKKGELKC